MNIQDNDPFFNIDGIYKDLLACSDVEKADELTQLFIKTLEKQETMLIQDVSHYPNHCNTWRQIGAFFQERDPKAFQLAQSLLGGRSLEKVIGEIQHLGQTKSLSRLDDFLFWGQSEEADSTSRDESAIFIISSQESTERGAAAIENRDEGIAPAISEERFSIDALRSRPIPDKIMKIADESIVEPMKENLKPIVDELDKNNLHIEMQDDDMPITLIGKKPGSDKVIERLDKKQVYYLIAQANTNKLPILMNHLMQLESTPAPVRLNPTHLLSILKTSGLNSGVKKFLLSQQQFNNHPISFNLYSKDQVALYRELAKYGYSIDAVFLSNILLAQDYPFIKAVLEQESDDWWKINAASILKALMKTEDPQTAELMMQRFPKMGTECPVDLLVEAVSSGKQDFVHWLLISGLRLPKESMKDLLESAVKTKNLRLIRELCTYAEKQGIDCPSYPEILGLEALELAQTTVIEKTLFGYALFSPLEEIYALVKQYPSFSSALPSVLRKISLVVRFPSIEQAQEVNEEFSDREAYIDSSLAYAKENLKFLTEAGQAQSLPTRSQLLDAIIADRYERMPVKNKGYITKQIDEPDIMNTPLWRYKGKLHGIGGQYYADKMTIYRYHWSFRHFASLCYDVQKNQWNPPKDWQDDSFPLGSIWIYNYTIPGTNESLSINTFSQHSKLGNAWDHPMGPTIAKLQEHLDELHDSIMNYKLDLNDTENKRLFFEKVARCYFLQAVLCETHRGTPHNVMIWLNHVYDHHGLPPPIPNRDHFFLDNTMLMLSVEEAIKRWHTFFEPSLP